MTDAQLRNERARRKSDQQRVVRSLNIYETETILKSRHRDALLNYRREHARRCRDIENDIWGSSHD